MGALLFHREEEVSQERYPQKTIAYLLKTAFGKP